MELRACRQHPFFRARQSAAVHARTWETQLLSAARFLFRHPGKTALHSGILCVAGGAVVYLRASSGTWLRHAIYFYDCFILFQGV